MRKLLSPNEQAKALTSLEGWSKAKDREAIKKLYKFNDFVSAMNFMNNVAIIAEEMDHHPEWCNVYNRVDVTLTTHSAKGITQLDIDLAKAMDDIY